MRSEQGRCGGDGGGAATSACKLQANGVAGRGRLDGGDWPSPERFGRLAWPGSCQPSPERLTHGNPKP